MKRLILSAMAGIVAMIAIASGATHHFPATGIGPGLAPVYIITACKIKPVNQTHTSHAHEPGSNTVHSTTAAVAVEVCEQLHKLVFKTVPVVAERLRNGKPHY